MSVAAGTVNASIRSVGVGILAMPATLYVAALAVRLWATGMIGFPMTEGSAYYIAVARNLVAGRGLEIDAIWSYATPPLTLPRPAFELWQPMASFLAAAPMALVRPTLDGAQIGFAALGALLAPMAWYIGRDAARRLELGPRREQMVALAAGLIVAVCGPLVLFTAVPDSTLPFTLLGVAACLAMPAALAGRTRAVVYLGVLLGLAYLTRMEAAWLGLAFAALLIARQGSITRSLPRLAVVAGVAAIVAAPWWLRNAAVFGTPLPGQVTDNMFLVSNEQIFAYLDQPTLDGFLAQGLPTILANIANAAWHDAVNVLFVPVGVAAVAGVLTIAVAAFRRSQSLSVLSGSALGALLLSGALTFAMTTVLFPVATLWGTFEHAAGPLLIGLVVAGVLGADAFVAAVVRWRKWPRSNAWLVPLALVGLTVPLTAIQLTGAARQARTDQVAIGTLATTLPEAFSDLSVSDDAVLISDRPIWLSDVLHRAVIALPDEAPESVLQLARDFNAAAIVVVEGRGRHPDALRQGANAGCFSESVVRTPESDVSVFAIDQSCVR